MDEKTLDIILEEIGVFVNVDWVADNKVNFDRVLENIKIRLEEENA